MAIDSNTVILLEPGEYDLTAAFQDSINPLVSTNYTWYDAQPVIHGISNLTIKGNNQATLLISPVGGWVVQMIGGKNIHLEGITFGHTKPGHCDGGVLSFERVQDLVIKDCRLFGSGTYGIDLIRTDRVTISGCEIYECTYGLMNMVYANDVVIDGTNFLSTGEFDMFSFSSSRNIRFLNCLFSENFATGEDYPFFNIFEVEGDSVLIGRRQEKYIPCDSIIIQHCTFHYNSISTFTNLPEVLKLRDNEYFWNDFEDPE